MKKGEWIKLPRKFRVECCKCGLRHVIEVRVSKGVPQWRATPGEAIAHTGIAPTDKWWRAQYKLGECKEVSDDIIDQIEQSKMDRD